MKLLEKYRDKYKQIIITPTAHDRASCISTIEAAVAACADMAIVDCAFLEATNRTVAWLRKEGFTVRVGDHLLISGWAT